MKKKPEKIKNTPEPEKVLYFKAVDNWGRTHFDVKAGDMSKFNIRLRGDAWVISFYYK